MPAPIGASARVQDQTTSHLLSESSLVSSSRYRLEKCIGQGSYGKVYKAIDTVNSNAVVAIKCITLNSTADHDGNLLGPLLAEVKAMSSLFKDHDVSSSSNNIVKYHTSLIRPGGSVWIVMEFCALGSLRDMLRDRANSGAGLGLSEGAVLIIAEQVLKALSLLHEQGLVHRDLKAANLLVDAKGRVKVGDFGVAMLHKSNVGDSNDQGSGVEYLVGSPYWMAPEVIKSGGLFGEKRGGGMFSATTPDWRCDIWSFGCLLIELCTGNPPYAMLSPKEAMRRLATEMPPPCPDSVKHKELRQCIEMCLNDDPDKRPSANRLLSILHSVLHHHHPLMAVEARQEWKESWQSRKIQLEKEEASPITPVIEDDSKTLASEWTFGSGLKGEGRGSIADSTIASSTCSLTEMMSAIMSPRLDLGEELSLLKIDKEPQPMSPLIHQIDNILPSICQPGEAMQPALPPKQLSFFKQHLRNEAKKYITDSLKDTELGHYSSFLIYDAVRNLIDAKRAACPHIILNGLVKERLKQNIEQANHAKYFDSLLAQYKGNLLQASLQYYNETLEEK